jgi:WD40 repeat protein
VAVSIAGRKVALWRLGWDGLTLIGEPEFDRVGDEGMRVVAVGQVGGQSMAVTGGWVGRVALWRLGPDGVTPIGDVLQSHRCQWVKSVAIGQLGGHSVAVTGGSDGTVGLWRVDPGRLALIGAPQQGHSGYPVEAATVGQLGGHSVAVTGGGDGTVAIWRLDAERLPSEPVARIAVGSPPISIVLSPPEAMILWCRDGVLTAEIRTSRI